ncbi:MAG: glycoside hydrolase family protein [Planctomycetota bacterium]
MSAEFQTPLDLPPIARDNGFRLPDHWVWDGSLIEHPAGPAEQRWHLFASRWPKRLPMHPGWLLESEIVRATAPSPTGPFTFQEVVLPRRDKAYFDGRMTHNPSIRKVVHPQHGEVYLLFYIGVTYGVEPPQHADDYPREDVQQTDPWLREVWLKKRIGLATAPSLLGPWTRRDQPILHPRPGYWDDGTTSNPSPLIRSDGSILLAYKSSNSLPDPQRRTTLRPFQIGLAHATAYDQPFTRLSNQPVLPPRDASPGGSVEDPFLFKIGDTFHLFVKDLSGQDSGKKCHGLHATTQTPSDAASWRWADSIDAYSLDVTWQEPDGTRTPETLAHIERPQLVFDAAGKPTHFTASCARGQGDLQQLTDTWISVFPLPG